MDPTTSSPSESVKDAVRHSSKCTPDTVALLRSLLSVTRQDSSHSKSKAIKDGNRPPASKNSKLARTRAPTKTPVYRGPTSDPDTPALSRHEKLVLATDVFNIASKSISECIERLETSNPSTASQPKKTTLEDGGRSAPKSPLQPTSPNRKITRSPAKTKATKECVRAQDISAIGVTSVADCARTSLSCLRVLRNDENESGSLNIQLEQGLCILVGKLTAAGLTDMAGEELRKLRRRIISATGGGGTKRTQEEAHDKPADDPLEEVIRIEHVSSNRCLLPLVISFQSRVLTLILAERRPSSVNKLPAVLALSNPSSPCSLILAAHSQSLVDGGKAVKQLQALSRTVLSLEPNVSSSTDSKPVSAKTRVKPMITLSLQLLSLEIRCLCWRISQHRCDEERDLWAPLARYFSAFARRSSTVRAVEYDYIKEAFLRLQSTTRENGYKLADTTSRDSSLSTVFKTLGQLSHSASLIEDAIKYYGLAIEHLPQDSHLQFASCRCRFANLLIESLSEKSSSRAASAIDEAATALSSPLRGSQLDMEELLIESARLKKAAMGTMAPFGNAATSKYGGEQDGVTVFRISTTNYLISFIRLLNRYLVPSTSQQSDGNSPTKGERFQKFRNVVSAAVDSCISIGKLAISTAQPPWTDIEPLLSDCIPLLMGLQEDGDGQSEPGMPNRQSGFVRLSNVYWSLYISEKDKGKAPEKVVQAAERSVSILLKLHSADQASGLLAIKLEKLAGLYADIGQHSKANSTRVRSIGAHLRAAVLDSVEHDFSKKHPFQIWRDPQSPIFALGRVLHAYVRARLRGSYSDATCFYDDKRLGEIQRGILLEHQLTIITEAPNSASDLTPHISSIIPALLSLYPLDDFPIRRTRVVLQGLQFMVENGSLMEDSMRETLLFEARKCVSSSAEGSADRDLSHFKEYTMSSLRLALGFAVGDLSTDTLSEVVESWVSMVQGCGGCELLESKIDDLPTWLSQARATVDYLDTQGLWRLKLRTLAVIRRLLGLQSEPDLAAMVLCLSQTGLQYCRLGYTEQAQVFLSRADTIVKQNQTDFFPLAQLTWLLAYSEHFLAENKADRSAEVLSEAQSVFEEHSLQLSREGFRTKCQLERLVGDAAGLLSQLSLSKGDFVLATYYAKSAVKLSSRVWARLDRLVRKKRNTSRSDNTEVDVHAVSNKLASLDLSPTNPTTAKDTYGGSIFWPHLESHYSALVRLSRMAVLNGLFQDAVFYGEQALEVAQSIGSGCFVALIKAELGAYYIYAGQPQKGSDLLSAAMQGSKSLDQHLNTILLDLHKSTQARHAEEPEDENNALVRAYQTLSDISSNRYVESLDPFGEAAVAGLENGVKNLSVVESTSSRGRLVERQPKRSRGKPTGSGNSAAKKVPYQKAHAAPDESLFFSNIRGEILHRQAKAAMSSHDLTQAGLLLEQVSKHSLSLSGRAYHSIVISEYQLASAIQKLSAHEVYCVLRESTISLPSIHVNGTADREERCAPTNRKTRAMTSKRKTNSAAQSPRKSVPVSRDEFNPLLSNASDSLNSISNSTTQYSSTKDNHHVSFLLSRISMLAHATMPKHGAAQDICAPASAAEFGRNISFKRERTAIDFDKELGQPPQSLVWPKPPPQQPNMASTLCSDFMHEYVDILPSDWQVVSLTLSADRSEFVISRLRAGQTPFMLFLPLKRSDPEVVDDDEFNFDSGRQELQEIIKLANETAHATEARFDKKSKKQWWVKRETLDGRLKTLLRNIETIWFGGFRGIFAPKPRDDTLLSTFTEAFQKLLDKHLPSRRKRGRGRAPNATIDGNVMELFMNIGCLDDASNPEDAVMDLLYFVVDILQFHGERNAYDEIDFDMMVVETLDTLRSLRGSEQVSRQQEHTILILDRALHSFPWESLECLRESSVSRMPSLDCLRERILQAQDTRPSKACADGYHVDHRDGSYILNPNGDLSSTQTSFEASLSRLEDWTRVVKREPSEDEFKQALETRDLLLYFGHGSGAQYIRGRTIRRLDRCAVTFLMGCSSGSMTDAGEFESYGVPCNYMHAGAPALVATLWDVTDKDIDRFAQSAFEEWGLLERPSRGTESALPCISGGGEATALDTAVARSRGACILRYLNGAAPVVYGIPVFLK